MKILVLFFSIHSTLQNECSCPFRKRYFGYFNF